MIRAFPSVVSMALLAVVSACSAPPPPTPSDRASAATQAACRQRAEEIYQQQNRGELYRSDQLATQADSPLSAGGLKGFTPQGLSQRYDYGSIVQDCLRSSQAATESSQTGAPGPALRPPPVR